MSDQRLLLQPTTTHLFLTGNPGVGKTTAILRVANAALSSQHTVGGFYTQECRSSATTTNNNNNERIGFDIVTFSPSKQRIPLARIGKGRGGSPTVGKYVVNVPNIRTAILPSLESTSSSSSSSIQLLVMDEIGKMELKCDTFFPTILHTLNETNAVVVIGTIPTPRYGRCIPEVEELRGRDDVMVISLTKSNRDDVGEALEKAVLEVLLKTNEGDDDEEWSRRRVYERWLKDYRYDRPIEQSPSKRSLGEKEEGTTLERGAGPLLHETIPPKVLLLGETASPANPTSPESEYSERSFWNIFASMLSSSDVRNQVLQHGIGIWDVLSNVHSKQQRRKRPRQTTPNDFTAFLQRYPSVIGLAFNGKKAREVFGQDVIKVEKTADTVEWEDVGRTMKLVVLPSSSPKNVRMSLEEKVERWRLILGEFCPDLVR